MNENENINNETQNNDSINRYDKYSMNAENTEFTTGYQSIRDTSAPAETVTRTEAASATETPVSETPTPADTVAAGTLYPTEATPQTEAAVPMNETSPAEVPASAETPLYSVEQNGEAASQTYSNNYMNYVGGQNDYYNRYTETSGSSFTGEPAAEANPPKQRSGAAKFFIGLGCAAAFGLVAAGIFIGTLFLYDKYAVKNAIPTPSTNTSVEVTTNKNELPDNTQLNVDPVTNSSESVPATSIINTVNMTSTDVSEIVEKCMPSIVSINVKLTQNTIWGKYKADAAGSGIIIEKNDDELIIATNNHVVESTDEISISFCDGTSAPATIKGLDSVADLGVVSVKLSDLSEDTLKAISVAEMGNSDDVKVGQMAIAIGNSLGYGQSVTVGYISAKDREVTVENQKMILLQTDAAINPGNSGGALLNLNGQVVGINSAKYAEASVEGMGFAIPISRAQNILADLATREIIATEDQGYLGIYYSPVTAETAKSYNWPMGVYITSLVEGGAAESAGLKVGDIITGIDDMQITSSQQLLDKLAATRYGTKVTIKVMRLIEGDHQEMSFEVTLGQRPAEDKNAKDDQSDKDEKSEDKKPEEGKEPGTEGNGEQPGTDTPDDGSGYYYNPDDFFDDFFGNDPFDFFFGY